MKSGNSSGVGIPQSMASPRCDIPNCISPSTERKYDAPWKAATSRVQPVGKRIRHPAKTHTRWQLARGHAGPAVVVHGGVERNLLRLSVLYEVHVHRLVAAEAEVGK